LLPLRIASVTGADPTIRPGIFGGAVDSSCDPSLAHRMICSRGLDLTHADASTPIGGGCKGRERWQ